MFLGVTEHTNPVAYFKPDFRAGKMHLFPHHCGEEVADTKSTWLIP